MADSPAAAAATAANHYKKLKEDFVSNLSGGSTSEVVLVTVVAPVGIIWRSFVVVVVAVVFLSVKAEADFVRPLLRSPFLRGPSSSAGSRSSAPTPPSPLSSTSSSTSPPSCWPSPSTPTSPFFSMASCSPPPSLSLRCRAAAVWRASPSRKRMRSLLRPHRPRPGRPHLLSRYQRHHHHHHHHH